MRGDWNAAYETLKTLSSWKLIPKCEAVLAMLKQKLQEEGLRTYLFAYGAYYKSLSHAQLATMFDLPEKKVLALKFLIPAPSARSSNAISFGPSNCKHEA